MKKIIAAILVLFSLGAFAHSGGTDKYGCHYDKYGNWHCH